MADRGKGEKCREEEICGEIIIPGVTVAAFFEVDVNKILSYTIHFNFNSEKRRCGGVGVVAGKKEALCVQGKNTSRTYTQTHICLTPSQEVAGDVLCLQTDGEAHHCL